MVAKDIFLEAVDLPREDQQSFIEEACGSNEPMRLEVQSLLAHHGREGSVLSCDLGVILATELVTMDVECGAQQDDDRVGRYSLGPQLGRGGCGSVFLAKQTSPVEREVAIKMISPHANSAALLRRFDFERRAQARMEHPNIARMLDAGSVTPDQPFLVLEYVDGTPITQYCSREQLGLRERLNLFLDVCRGIEHAHQKGVVHRDIKPSKVLVTVIDGRPVAKVIDFGVAKAVSSSNTRDGMTVCGEPIGSPEYMSPEQAEPDGDVDTRSDIYSLGVLLYEMLCGKTPFAAKYPQGADYLRIVRFVCDEEPLPLSHVVAELRAGGAASPSCALVHVAPRISHRELTWITAKCLAKHPNDRYGSVHELVADLRRHLRNEPVSAGPPSCGYRVRKFVQRNRGLVLAACAVAVSIFVGLVGATVGIVRASQATAHALEQKEVAEWAGRRAEETNLLVERILDSVVMQGRGNEGANVVRSALDDMQRRLDRGSVEDPLVKAEMRRLIGNSYMKLGHYAEAERQFQEGVTIGTIVGFEHPDYLSNKAALACFYEYTAQYQRALEIHLEVYDVRRRVTPNHHGTIQSAHNIGRLYRRLKDYDRAEVYLKVALQIGGQQLEQLDHRNLNSRYDYGLVLWCQGRRHDACQEFGQLLELEKSAWGDNHPMSRRTMHCLTKLHLALGRPQEALRMAEKMNSVDERLGRGDARRLALLSEAQAATGDTLSARLTQARALDLASGDTRAKLLERFRVEAVQ